MAYDTGVCVLLGVLRSVELQTKVEFPNGLWIYALNEVSQSVILN